MQPASFKNMQGQRFHRLLVLERAGSDKNGNARWRCQCDCGSVIETHGFNLRNGDSKSCGCLTTEQLIARNTTHQMTGSPEHRAWAGMLQRCRNPKDTKYHRYGGRGIRVCERWEIFENFYADMGPRPSPQYSLERSNNDGNYEPGNVVWATLSEQNSNKCNNHYVVYRGHRMTLTRAIKMADMGVQHTIAVARMNRGWTLEEAIETKQDPVANSTLIDLTNQRFSRLLVISRADNNRLGHVQWHCVCDCGAKTIVPGNSLKAETTKSCGCLSKEVARERRLTHGKTGSAEYQAWNHMLGRCYNPANRNFKTHGARGIQVVDRWKTFENFHEDVGDRPSPQHRFSRSNLDKDFGPGNGKWSLVWKTR